MTTPQPISFVGATADFRAGKATPRDLLRRRPCTAQDSRERGGPGSDKDSHLEARGARQCHGRGIRKSFRLLLFHGSTCPLGRAGRSGQAVLFLASDDSSYIKAVELMVDGGLTGAPFGAPILRG
jgi:hypothetical protein